MVALFGVWVGFTPTPSTAEPGGGGCGPGPPADGQHTGKEVRFGDTSSALFGVSSTMTSTGSADAAYDSFNPMGGFGLLTGMMLGEVSPGGVGSGMYTILLFAIIAVFIGGLMIGEHRSIWERRSRPGR